MSFDHSFSVFNRAMQFIDGASTNEKRIERCCIVHEELNGFTHEQLNQCIIKYKAQQQNSQSNTVVNNNDDNDNTAGNTTNHDELEEIEEEHMMHDDSSDEELDVNDE